MQITRMLAKVEERPGACLLLAGVLLAAQVSPWWIPTGDGPSYLSLARHLAAGDGLLRFGQPRLFHPPGYSAIIAPAFLLAARPFAAIMVIHLLLALAFLLGVHRWTTRLFGREGIWVTALVAVNAAFWYYYRRTGSEIAFIAVGIWAVNVLTLALETPGRRAFGWLLAGAVLTAFLCVTRPVGVFFAAGFGLAAVALAFQRKLSWARGLTYAAVIGGVALAAAGGLVLHEQEALRRQAKPVRTNLERMRDARVGFAAQLAEGARLRASEVGRMMLPGLFKTYDREGRWFPVTALLYAPVCLLVLAGWWALAWRWDVFIWTAPFYTAMYVVWPYSQGTRFMMPMLPVLWAAAWALLARWNRRAKPVAALLIAAHLIMAVVFWANDLREARRMDRYWPELDRVAAAVGDSSAPGAIAGIDRDIGSMLAIASQRQWKILAEVSQAPERVRWILTDAKSPEAAGFRLRGRYGDFRLLERDDADR